MEMSVNGEATAFSPSSPMAPQIRSIPCDPDEDKQKRMDEWMNGCFWSGSESLSLTKPLTD